MQSSGHGVTIEEEVINTNDGIKKVILFKEQIIEEEKDDNDVSRHDSTSKNIQDPLQQDDDGNGMFIKDDVANEEEEEEEQGKDDEDEDDFGEFEEMQSSGHDVTIEEEVINSNDGANIERDEESVNQSVSSKKYEGPKADDVEHDNDISDKLKYDNCEIVEDVEENVMNVTSWSENDDEFGDFNDFQESELPQKIDSKTPDGASRICAEDTVLSENTKHSNHIKENDIMSSGEEAFGKEEKKYSLFAQRAKLIFQDIFNTNDKSVAKNLRSRNVASVDSSLLQHALVSLNTSVWHS
jgi:hypothetical protein